MGSGDFVTVLEPQWHLRQVPVAELQRLQSLPLAQTTPEQPASAAAIEAPAPRSPRASVCSGSGYAAMQLPARSAGESLCDRPTRSLPQPADPHRVEEIARPTVSAPSQRGPRLTTGRMPETCSAAGAQQARPHALRSSGQWPDAAEARRLVWGSNPTSAAGMPAADGAAAASSADAGYLSGCAPYSFSGADARVYLPPAPSVATSFAPEPQGVPTSGGCAVTSGLSLASAATEPAASKQQAVTAICVPVLAPADSTAAEPAAPFRPPQLVRSKAASAEPGPPAGQPPPAGVRLPAEVQPAEEAATAAAPAEPDLPGVQMSPAAWPTPAEAQPADETETAARPAEPTPPCIQDPRVAQPTPAEAQPAEEAAATAAAPVAAVIEGLQLSKRPNAAVPAAAAAAAACVPCTEDPLQAADDLLTVTGRPKRNPGGDPLKVSRRLIHLAQ